MLCFEYKFERFARQEATVAMILIDVPITNTFVTKITSPISIKTGFKKQLDN